MKITNGFVKDLPTPTKGNKRYYDGGKDRVKGFGVRVTANGNRSFILRYHNSSGLERIHTIGEFPTPWNADAARKEAERLKYQIEHAGFDPLDEKRVKRGAETVADLAAKYQEEYMPRKRESSAYQDRAMITRFVIPELGKIKVADVRFVDIDALHNKLTRAGTPTQANRVLALLSKMFNLAVRWQLREANPCAAIERNAERSRERTLNEDEIRWLLQVCDIVGYPYGWAVKLLLLTAQRKSEVSGMVAAELDGRTWTIPGERTKNGKTHLVHLSDASLGIVEAAREAAPAVPGFVFTKTGKGPLTSWSRVKATIDAHMLAVAGAAIEPWTVHDLRRTAVTIMNEKLRIAPHIIEAAVNHISGPAKSGVAGTYNRALYLEERALALDAWAAYVEGLIRPQLSNVVRLTG